VHWPRFIEGMPKTVTISKEADGWYMAISCDDVPVKRLPRTGQETGTDVGIKSFATRADGEHIFPPAYNRRAEAYLRRCQRRVDRRKKGSQRRRKAVVLLAKAHQHIANQRRDFHHQVALKLVRAYDVIYVEAIQPANLSRRPTPKPAGNGGYRHNGASRKAGLNQSILDAGWSSFRTILTFKAASAEKRVEAVSPAYTTQDCSNVLLYCPTGRWAASECRYRSQSARTCAPSVAPSWTATRTPPETACDGDKSNGTAPDPCQSAGIPPSGANVVRWEKRSLRTRRDVSRAECQIPLTDQYPEAHVIEAETVAQIRRLLEALPEPEHELLALRFAARLSSAQIAALTGKSEAATKKQLSRLLHRLQEQCRRVVLEELLPGLLEPVLRTCVAALLQVYGIPLPIARFREIRKSLLLRAGLGSQ
jgi:RNA polymerase sigma factor (sigma-70 family)